MLRLRITGGLLFGLDNHLEGSADADEIWGFGGNDYLYGGAGDDVLLGGADNDALLGEAGNDFLEGEEGNDWLLFGGDGDDEILGGPGDDQIYLDRGNNIYNGGADIDTFLFDIRVDVHNSWLDDFIVLMEYEHRVKVDIETGETFVGNEFFGTNTFTGIEIYDLTRYSDEFRGDDAGSIINAGGGNDVIEGRGGGDEIHGDYGIDTADYASSPAGVTVTTKTIEFGRGYGGDAEGDRLYDVENLSGSAFDDTLTGDHGENRLAGADGNDTLIGHGGRDELYGDAGADTLFGSGANDSLYGGAGDDVLVGGAGADFLKGDAGSDTFVFNSINESNANSGRDVILGFKQDQFASLSGGGIKPLFDYESDTIDLSAIDANQSNGWGSGGNQAFDFIGANPFSKFGQLRVSSAMDSEGFTFYKVEGNVDSDLGADFSINVYTTGTGGLNVTDFIL